MGFKSIISTIFASFLLPNKGTDAGVDVQSRMQRNSPAAAAAAAECAVCLSSLNSEMDTRVLPCMHEFHGVCVERWLAVPHFKNTCPICRFLMEEDCRNGGDDHEMRRQQECFTDEMVIWFSSFHVAGF